MRTVGTGRGVEFVNRREAGRRLAQRLRGYAGRTDVLVLALPRGGVPVAYEVARALHAPLDLFMVRKLGVPGHEEFAMGAIATGGIRVLSADTIAQLGIPPKAVERVIAREEAELARRERTYREGHPPQDVAGRTVIVVDDGLATGATMAAAVAALKQERPREIIVAAPVASREAHADLERAAGVCIAVATPEPFHSVGAWYRDFDQTTDDDVRRLLADARVGLVSDAAHR